MILIFFRHFVKLPAKNQPLLDTFWDISRDWETSKNDNSAWKINNGYVFKKLSDEHDFSPRHSKEHYSGYTNVLHTYRS